jgi:ribonuclease HI
MQAVMEILVHAALRLADVSVDFDIYVDGAIFFGSTRDLRNVLAAFRRVCSVFRVTIGDTVEPTVLITWRGATLDLTTRRAAIKQRARNKLETRVKWLATTGVASEYELRSMVGLLSSFDQVIGVDRVKEMYHTYSLLSHVEQFDLAFVAVPPLVFREWNNTVEGADRSVPFAITPRWFNTLVVSDASNTGWAAVVVSEQGTVHWCQGKRSGDEHINVGEAKALLAGVQLASPQRALALRTDSTVVCSIVQKRYCGNIALFRVLRALFQLVPARSLQVRWVPSAANPADGLSRGQLQPQHPSLWTPSALAGCCGSSWHSG